MTFWSFQVSGEPVTEHAKEGAVAPPGASRVVLGRPFTFEMTLSTPYWLGTAKLVEELDPTYTPLPSSSRRTNERVPPLSD